ncbi:MAG: DUF1588 domain-containing protein [Deltaproteobacteria bacterium]|nr:DUF1588 domain-containing protein [Nannocystaceae bacterium]
MTSLAVLVLNSSGCGDGGPSSQHGDGDDSSDDDDEGPAPDVVVLAPGERLVRISMALRGIRPSAAELDAVEADPNALGAIVDGYLGDPGFGETIRDLHNEALLVLSDYFIYPAGYPAIGPLEGRDPYALNRAITEAPLRLIEHVVMNDRPYGEIVTADYTVADAQVAAVWGLAGGGEDNWQETRWSDGRDNAGILSDGWLFQRHSSTPSNANRGRANAVSRALLCYDFADRDIVVDATVDLADPDEVADAVVDNPACASCHQGLDPLASFFGDFFPLYIPADIVATPAEDQLSYPLVTWYPGIFELYLGVPMREPSYFGSPADGLAGLGQRIAEDPRFSLCAAQRFYAYFHQVDLEAVPAEQAAELQGVLVDSGMDAKALTRAIVMSDAFAASHLEAPEEVEDPELDVVGVKKARPLQLRRLFADLTGFEWRTDLSVAVSEDTPNGLGVVPLLDDSFLGYAVLAGGLDSIYVTRASHTYSATVSLVLRALAQLSATSVVDADFAVAADQRRLLDQVEPGTADEATIRAQLVALHLRLYGDRVAADSEDVDAGWQLFSAALAHGGDPVRAWKVTLTALLQDVRIAYY